MIRPLPGLPIIRDLIVDMTQFFAQYHSVKPYVINDDAAAGEGAAAVAATSARSSTASTNASCARAARPRARRFWWNPDKFVGPAGLLQAYRFIADSRDKATNERLDDLEDPYRLFRCHTIMNCVDVCPKGLNPTLAIGKIKELLRAAGGLGRCDGRARAGAAAVEQPPRAAGAGPRVRALLGAGGRWRWTKARRRRSNACWRCPTTTCSTW